jgi:DNA-binding MarR family transcriptional regulator
METILTKTSAIPDDHVGEIARLLSKQAAFLWRIHTMSALMVKPVHENFTLRYGLSVIDWRIIMTLARAPDTAANEIVQIWSLDKMAVNRGVRHLLQRGLIERRPDPNDNRRQLMRLTPKGVTIHEEAWPGAETHYRQLTSVLTASEIAAFIATADKLIAEAARIADATAARAAAAKNAGRRTRR